jgi:DNA-binding response OmpR family regulator
MKIQHQFVTSGIVTAISVSPFAEDYCLLLSALGGSKWKLYKAETISAALPTICKRGIGVVICERELSPGSTWTDMLKELRLLRVAPPLIVTSRLADDKLWVEALNLGAYDVLAKPFARIELLRVVSLAGSCWHLQQEVPKVLNAAQSAC